MVEMTDALRHKILAIHTKTGLEIYARSGRLMTRRGPTITEMLKNAGLITGRIYKRGEAAIAAGDVANWIEANP